MSRAPAPPRLTDLEGYRGIAATAVVVFHAYQFCRAGGRYAFQGTIGGRVLVNLDGLVSMFLVLSAFVLYLPVVAAVRAGDRPRTARVFLGRRAVRILPLYWIAVVVVWSTRNPTLPGDWRDLLEHLTFTQVFDNRRIFFTIGPAWSLAVEVYFYLFLALFHVVARGGWVARLRPAARVCFLMSPALLLMSASAAWFWWATVLSPRPAGAFAIWFNPLAKAYMFGAGMLLAIVATWWSEYPSRYLAHLLRIAAVVLYGCACTVRAGDALSGVLFNALATLSAVALLGASIRDDPRSRWRRVMGGRAFLFAGLISYSVYMWHEPILLSLNSHHLISDSPSAFPALAVILLLLSVPAGVASYWVIEYPFGQLRYLRRPEPEPGLDLDCDLDLDGTGPAAYADAPTVELPVPRTGRATAGQGIAPPVMIGRRLPTVRRP